MRSIDVRAIALVVSVVMPSTAFAAPRRSLLEMRDEEPAVIPADPPAPMLGPVEPAPEAIAPTATPIETAIEPRIAEPTPDPPIAETAIEPTATTPPPEVAAQHDELVGALARAEQTRDVGATTLVAGGAVTIVGVILIFAGFGATAAATKRSGCTDDECRLADSKTVRAARVTLAGLFLSGLGVVTLGSGIAVYGVGHARVSRARQASFEGLAVEPLSRGGGLTMRGRF